MVLTPSTMMALGTKGPDFELIDVRTSKKVSLLSFKKAKGLVIIFMCKHCPYVKHIEKELAKFGKDYAASEVGIVGVSSNDAANYPDDAPAKLKEMAESLGLFPLLYDESQAAAKGYQAACTPDIYVLDGAGKLAYRGQFDDSRPGNNLPVTGKDLRLAVDALSGGKPAPKEQKPSIGCNIKWKPGQEPAYFQ